MANLLSKIKLGTTTYDLKDAQAREDIAAIQAAISSSLVFKGVVASESQLPALSTASVGWTYKVSTGFTSATFGKVEPGDMIICIDTDNGTAVVKAWTVLQNNIDVFDSTGVKGLVPSATSGDATKFLRGDGTWADAGSDIAWGTFSSLINP